MPITIKNIIKHELIGLFSEVKESRNKSQNGIKGKIMNETRNTFVIKDKKIQKEGSTFIFTLPDGKKVKIDGKLLVGRPEDRIRKKVKKWL